MGRGYRKYNAGLRLKTCLEISENRGPERTLESKPLYRLSNVVCNNQKNLQAFTSDRLPKNRKDQIFQPKYLILNK
jgi:hypothetical protein